MEITAEACRRNIQNLGKHEKYVDYSEISLRDNGPLSQKKHELDKIKNKKLEKLRRCQFDVDSNEYMPDKFAILRTVPDGNSFYRCLSLEIHGVENKHEAVRKAVVTHMQSNVELYSMYVDGDYSKLVEYQGHSEGRASLWATEAEIYATATLYNCIIFVYKVSDQGITKLRFQSNEQSRRQRKIILKLENQHFDFY